MRRLLLCRHAKSSWKDGTLRDFDRPLNKRGRQNAPAMGRRLRKMGVRPDLLLTSPARRALDTARLLAGELQLPDDKFRVVGEMYDSYPAKLLQLIQGLDDRSATVLLVGHNPEMTMFANLLGAPCLENIPTAGVVVLDFAAAAWAQIDEGSGTLAFFEYPRKPEE